ncbi:MAG: hypothetical protein HP023_08165 [Lachnospiraceae bacterium]|nr:hypothetical protein [Lachnospiraceae bacterium]
MKQRKKLIILCGLMLAAASPIYAESATEAVAISDTASAVAQTSDANVEAEMQSVFETDTSETSVQETNHVTLPAIWQETYTYLADTQDAHAFPEQIKKSGVLYQLKDVQYQITELTNKYQKSSVDMWAYAEYTPEQEIEVDGLQYTLVDTSKEEWIKSGRSKTVSVERTYLDGQEVPEAIDIESMDDVTGETIYGNIPRTDLQDDGAGWWEGGLEQWVKYRWSDETSQWIFDVNGESFLAASEESPWFEGCGVKILESLHLDGTFNVITNVAWDSDGWQEADGSWWKSVKATGNRMVKRSRAWFSGEVAEADLPMVRYTSRYVSDVTGYLITANVTYEEILPEPETETEVVTQTPETVLEQTQAENVSDSDTNKTIVGMPWQDLVLLFLETGSVALGFIMIGLLAKFRPKPRAWLNTKNVDRKGNKRKGEN